MQEKDPSTSTSSSSLSESDTSNAISHEREDAQALALFLDQFQGIEKTLMESAEKENNDERTILYAIDYIANAI